MYNDNKYFHYTRCIIKFLFLLYKKMYIIKYLFLLYKKMYNDNKYFHYTRRHKIFVSVIQEDV